MTEQLRLFDAPAHDEPTVYIARRLGAIKIGYTTNVQRRMAELGTTLLVAIPGSRDLEAALHRRFRQHRIAYEWFGPTPELLDFVERLRAVPELAAAA